MPKPAAEANFINQPAGDDQQGSRRSGLTKDPTPIWLLQPKYRLTNPAAASKTFAALFEESLSRQEMRIGEVITAEVTRSTPTS